MRPELQKAREAAVTLQDQAVAARAARSNAEFLAAMNDVVSRLRGIITAAEPDAKSLEDPKRT